MMKLVNGVLSFVVLTLLTWFVFSKTKKGIAFKVKLDKQPPGPLCIGKMRLQEAFTEVGEVFERIADKTEAHNV